MINKLDVESQVKPQGALNGASWTLEVFQEEPMDWPTYALDAGPWVVTKGEGGALSLPALSMGVARFHGVGEASN